MNILASGFAIRKNRRSSSFVAGQGIFQNLLCVFSVNCQRQFIPYYSLQAAGSIFGGLRRSASQSSHISEGRGAKSIVLNQGLYYIKRP